MTNENDALMLSKSLKLLHSKSEESTEQLRLIVEDTIKAKYGFKVNIPKGPLLRKKDWDGLKADNHPKKKSKLIDSVKSSTINTHQEQSPTTESDSDTDSDDDRVLEILEKDLTCVVCRGMAVGPRNSLVECIECHSLYHQECHNPPVLETTINDPRLVWYCDTCTKTMNQVQAKDGYSSSGSPSSSGSGSLSSKHSKTASSSKMTLLSGGSSKPFSGLTGGMNKQNMSSNALSNKHLALNSKSSSIVVPKINIISADKRLQIMKKKAAKKQEKRKLNK
uniref:Integrator complex subunit 12 n=1 Tax=Clastoptera arizonana TaxID=38151 RepID=A0A1B6CB99_9HEMI